MAWPVGCSSYIWSQHMDLKEHFPQVCGEIKAAGFEGLESFAGVILDPQGEQALRQGLQATGLAYPAAYVGGHFHKPEQRDQAIREAERAARKLVALGGRMLLVGPSPEKGRGKTPEELAIEAPAIAELAALIAPLGVRIAIHNHVPELLHHAAELEALLKAAPPDRVGLNVDTEWCVQADVDPVAFLKRFGPRVWHLHLRNSAHKVWSEHLGEGELDYPAIARTLREIGFGGWLMLEDAWDGKRKLQLSFEARARHGRDALCKWFGV